MKLEMLRREKMLSEASNNKDIQASLYELCKRDILFWFKNFIFTDKNSRYF